MGGLVTDHNSLVLKRDILIIVVCIGLFTVHVIPRYTYTQRPLHNVSFSGKQLGLHKWKSDCFDEKPTVCAAVTPVPGMVYDVRHA